MDEATRQTANAAECRIKSVSMRANGGVNIGLEVHADDAQHVSGFLPGMRFLVAFVRIDENENLVRGGSSDPDADQSHTSVRQDDEVSLRNNNATQECSRPTPSEGVTRVPGEIASLPRVNLATVAAMLVRNRQFQMWCHETFSTALTATAADQWLKQKCKIQSKREIVPDSYAASMLTWIRSAFKSWLEQNPSSRFA